MCHMWWWWERKMVVSPPCPHSVACSDPQIPQLQLLQVSFIHTARKKLQYLKTNVHRVKAVEAIDHLNLPPSSQFVCFLYQVLLHPSNMSYSCQREGASSLKLLVWWHHLHTTHSICLFLKKLFTKSAFNQMQSLSIK